MRALAQLLAAVVELSALSAFACRGWGAGGPRLLAALAAIAVPAALWSVLAAPKSARRLRGAALLGFKLAVFAAATLALTASGQGAWAAVFAAAAALQLGLALWLGVL